MRDLARTLGPSTPDSLNVHMSPDGFGSGGVGSTNHQDQFAPPYRCLTRVCGILEREGVPEGRFRARDLHAVVDRIYDLLNERAPDVDRVDFTAELETAIRSLVEVEKACFSLKLGEEDDLELARSFEQIGVRMASAFMCSCRIGHLTCEKLNKLYAELSDEAGIGTVIDERYDPPLAEEDMEYHYVRLQAHNLAIGELVERLGPDGAARLRRIAPESFFDLRRVMLKLTSGLYPHAALVQDRVQIHLGEYREKLGVDDFVQQMLTALHCKGRLPAVYPMQYFLIMIREDLLRDGT